MRSTGKSHWHHIEYWSFIVRLSMLVAFTCAVRATRLPEVHHDAVAQMFDLFDHAKAALSLTGLSLPYAVDLCVKIGDILTLMRAAGCTSVIQRPASDAPPSSGSSTPVTVTREDVLKLLKLAQVADFNPDPAVGLLRDVDVDVEAGRRKGELTRVDLLALMLFEGATRGSVVVDGLDGVDGGHSAAEGERKDDDKLLDKMPGDLLKSLVGC